MFENRVLDAAGVRCRVLIDGWRTVSPRFVFKGYDASVQGPLVAPGLNADGMLPGRFAALLIEAPTGLVLVDAGVGPFAGELEAGRLAGELDALGIPRTDIRTVLVTHGHADHVGGLVTNDGVPVFEDARHLVHRAELAFWRSPAARELPGDAAEPARVAFGALRAGGLLEEISTETLVGPQVRILEAPGHTPGHLAVVINDALLWAGDAITHPVNIPKPEWVSAADMSEDNARTRVALLGRAADDGLLLAASHLAWEGMVRRVDGGFAFDRMDGAVAPGRGRAGTQPPR
jgi:glyoxylase-like metal-dependent hydrolase (beta-lactamase superfamily II)